MNGILKEMGTFEPSSDPSLPQTDSTADADDESFGKVCDLATEERFFGIRLADTENGRDSASMLINRMYSWRGYAGSHKLEENPNRITLTATDKGTVIGTLTLGIDSELGILADDIFKEEIDQFRNQGAKVCEITKLAFDPDVRSKKALASLFHIAAIYARYLHNRTDIFIEVNPRHRRFYEHMLGFQRQGEPKMNTRVNAPAYLLCVNLDYVEEQVEKFAGNGHTTPADAARSFYPLFFSSAEVKGIVHRLLSLDQQGPEKG